MAKGWPWGGALAVAVGLAACMAKPEPEQVVGVTKARVPIPSASPIKAVASGGTTVFALSSLRGTAYGPQGQPKVGIEVSLVSADSSRPYRQRFAVSGGGAYVFTGVPLFTAFTLSAHAVGAEEALRQRTVSAISSATERRVVNLGGPNASEDPVASSHFVPDLPASP